MSLAVTPPRRSLQARGSSPIPERHALRKRKRPSSGGIAVLEGSKPIECNEDSEDCSNQVEGGTPQREQQTEKQQKVEDPSAAFAAALANLPVGFAEDFFLGHGHAKLNRSLAANAMESTPAAASSAAEVMPDAKRFSSWLQLLGMGFSLLVPGVGSKKLVLEEFAEKMVKPSGAVCVHVHAFDGRFSFCECLRGLLEQVYPDAPRQGASAEGLGAAVRAAVAMPGSRPLCFVVHSIENMSHPHLVILATMAASPGVHLVASTDNIWAPLAWGPQSLKDFNFCREEVNTFVGYEVEAKARHPRGLPPWSGLGQDKRRTPKASLSLVMKSLTPNHLELVQVMAKHQLESDSHAGISMSALLKVCTDRMIAANVPKLRSLLQVLRDHEVVVQRGCSSTLTVQALFYLPFDERTLQQIADGNALDSDDEGEEGAPGNDDFEEEVVV